MRHFFSFLFVIFIAFANAQELNCSIRVNSEKLAVPNQKVFKTLETSLNEFVNKTNWTTNNVKPIERISCSMTLIIDSYDSDQFTGSLQIQSSRPVYNSMYTSPVFNYNDKDISFKYIEFENLAFNPNTFDSNLTSLFAFYSYIIIAMDQDTFSKNGGESYYEIAQNIANNAQSGGYAGWTQTSKNQNRYFLINDVLSPVFSPFRDTMFEYHFQGMDLMSRDPKTAKQNIILAVNELKKINDLRPNSYLSRIFFDTKSDEIVTIFSGGPSVPITDFQDSLNRISPMNSSKWDNIK